MSDEPREDPEPDPGTPAGHESPPEPPEPRDADEAADFAEGHS